MKTTVALLFAVGLAVPLAAQTARTSSPASDAPSVSVRPFAVVSGEQFAASETFKAVFGRSFQPLWGGGAQVAFRNGFYVEASVSQFKKDGQRVFRSSTGQVFSLGNPLTVALMPIEFGGGYRFHLQRHEGLIPYVGGGAGYYGYKETCIADSARPGLCEAIAADVDTHKIGGFVSGGVEVRVHRWVGIAIGGQFSRVPGILGTGGVSSLAEVNESDLGGLSAQVKVIIGR